MKQLFILLTLALAVGAVAQGLLSLAGSPSNPPDILWWKLNAGSGTSIIASVGPGGTHDADYLVGKSGVGYCMDFNGTSDDANSSSAVTFGASIITVTMWMWMDDVSDTTIIVESSADPSANNHAWSIWMSSGRLRGYLHGTGAGTEARDESIVEPATGAWKHIGFVFDNSGTVGDIKIFVDGIEQSPSLDGNDKAGTANLAAYTVYFGARNSVTAPFNGRVDDVRIYAGDQSARMLEIKKEAE